MDNPSANISGNRVFCKSFNKYSRSKDSPFRMPPTQEGLGTDGRAVNEPDFRLKIDLKLPLRVGPCQFEIQSTARLSLSAMLGQEKARRASSTGFCLIKGKIGVGNQFIDAGAVIGRDSDACACSNANSVIVECKIFREPIPGRIDNPTDYERIATFW